jgi:ribosomal protein S18 acetylase RimI-like enzyme
MGPKGERHPTPPADPSGLVIRHATDEDSARIATLHADQIDQGFLTLLGPSFLRRLYRRIGREPASFLLVAESGGAIEGFIAGSTDVRALYRSFVLRDGVAAGASAARALVAGWRQVLDTLGHAGSKGAGIGKGAELLSIAVDPTRQRGGTGTRLVGAFLDELATRGCDAAHVVVGATNAGAIALYEREGFVTVDRFELHAGTESLLMQWERGGPPPPVRTER